MLDAASPGRLREVAQYKRASAHGGIAYDGSYIYLADGRQGLVVFEYPSGLWRKKET